MKPSSLAAWGIVVCLCGVAILNYLDRQVVFSLFPVLRHELKMSDVQLGLIGSAFLLVYGVVSLFAGLLAVQWGLRRTILLSLAIWSVVILVSGFVRSGTELIALRALMGSSEAFYMPAGLAFVMLLHGEATRSRATALHQSGNHIGMVAGGTLGGWFAEHWSWRSGFFVLGAVGIVYAGFLAVVFRRLTPPETALDAPRMKVRELARVLIALRGYPAMLAVFCLYSAAGWIVLAWMPLYLYEKFHMGLVEAGFSATFYFNVGSFTGIFLGAWASDRLAVRQASARLRLPAAGFLCSAVFLFAAAFAESRTVALAGLAIFGFGRGMYDCSTMPLLCMIAPRDLRAGGYGVFNCAGCLTGAVMTALAGWLKAGFGLAGSIEASAAGLLLAAWLMWKPITAATRPVAAAGGPLP
ncbi:MAG TPA: MFS transporter [Bryobacteraceae bacterium]|nr:MFS transporter [Bryobacteraceae bacterium]